MSTNKNNKSKSKRQKMIYTLPIWGVVTLFAYYTVLIILGFIGIIFIILQKDIETNLMINTLIGSNSICLLFCSIQYVKRLYKACLDKRITYDKTSSSFLLESIGNIVYFFFRPIFASAFVIVLIISLRSGLLIITTQDGIVMNSRFLYLCILISSFIGFSVGRVLDRFDGHAQQVIRKAFNRI